MAVSQKRKRFFRSAAPKFLYRRGLSPTLSWGWPRATLSPSFCLFLDRNHFFRVFHGSVFFWKGVRNSDSKYASGTPLHVGKQKIADPAKTSAELQKGPGPFMIPVKLWRVLVETILTDVRLDWDQTRTRSSVALNINTTLSCTRYGFHVAINGWFSCSFNLKYLSPYSDRGCANLHNKL